MTRLALRAAVFLGSAAIGLLVSALLVGGMTVSVSGFVTAVLVFAVVQAVLSPFIFKVATTHAPAFLGGIGLLATLIALILAAVFTDGLAIHGVGSWIAATVVVWLVTAVATLALPTAVGLVAAQGRRSAAS